MQELIDSTDTNIVETSTCLETTQQETTNFTVRILIKSDWSMFSCTPECSKQLPLWKYIANWRVLEHHIDAKISPKAASEKPQTMVSQNRYTSPKIDVFRTAILTFLVPTGDNAQASFLVHQVLRTSATVLRYRRMFMQFSLRVWASEYTCRPTIANLLYSFTISSKFSITCPISFFDVDVSLFINKASYCVYMTSFRSPV